MEICGERNVKVFLDECKNVTELIGSIKRNALYSSKGMVFIAEVGRI